MKAGCFHSVSTLEISEIYLEDVYPEGFYTKEIVHDFVKKGNIVRVNIGPDYPRLVPVISIHGERYVRSEANDSHHDNLLKLPRV